MQAEETKRREGIIPSGLGYGFWDVKCSELPFFRDLQVGEHGISLFLSKLFNGTLLAQHDENGQIIKDTVLKIDLRGELSEFDEMLKQADILVTKLVEGVITVE